MRRKYAIALASIALAAVSSVFAGNPIIQTKFTADPAPLVHDDVVYLYTTQDQDDAPPGMAQFRMRNWLLYTSTDMVNWTDHGVVANLRSFDWNGWGGNENGAWANQAIERNGKFYLYVTVHGAGIGVLVADSPFGPFADPLGKPLIGPDYDTIDPSVMIDDDGQAYLYWGNPNIWYVKLNEDMVSFAGEITKDSSMAKVKGMPDSYHYQEGPWVWKRDGQYYNAYASTCCPEGIGYAMSDSPEGPWEFKGYVVRPDRRSSGNHPGIIDYKGGSYVFGFNFKLNFMLTDLHHERRSICVQKFEYNPDGTIPELPWWEEAQSVAQIEPLNPTFRTEAETICWSDGMKAEPCSAGGMAVYPTRDGAYIKVQGVDFGTSSPGMFTASIACGTKPGVSQGGGIELHLDSVDGSLVGTLPVSYTAGEWKKETIAVSMINPAGLRDLYFVFKGESIANLCKLDWWQFTRKTSGRQLVAVNAEVERYKIDTVSGAANLSPVSVVGIYSDGSSKIVTAEAAISVENSEVVSEENGVVSGKANGEIRLVASLDGVSDEISLIVKDLESEFTPRKLMLSKPSMDLVVGNKQAFTVSAEYFDGHTEDVTDQASFTVADPKVVSIKDGVLTILDNGDTTVRVGFKGRQGKPVTASIHVTASYRNPYVQNMAAEFSAQQGVSKENSSEGGENICNIQNDEWVCYEALDFETGARELELRVASATGGGTIEICLDRVDTKPVGTCEVKNTGGWQSWKTETCKVRGVRGQHDVYFKFTGGSGYLLNVYDWQFKK